MSVVVFALLVDVRLLLREIYVIYRVWLLSVTSVCSSSVA